MVAMQNSNFLSVTLNDVEQARARLNQVAECTPLQRNVRLSEQYHAEIYLKREDLQVVRSYKLRGAYNLMATLSEQERERGIVCASAGNHAQGVAFTCRLLGIRGHIFMPQNTPKQKIERVRMHGGSTIEITLTGDTFDATYTEAIEYAKQHNAVFVPPFDHPAVIAGQGAVGLEILEQLGRVPDVTVCPIGGGGLISGIATVWEARCPEASLVGVEPASAACMLAAMHAGRPVALEKIDTFVDGAAVKKAGALNYEICARVRPQLLAVAEGTVCTEMIAMYQNDGIIAEPAGALSVAALPQLAEKIAGATVVCVVSGGNNDISRYPEILERSLIDQGLKHYFLIEFSQRAGALRRYLDEALGPNDDITLFEYIKKSNREFGPALVGVELSSRADLEPLLRRMESQGLQYEIISHDSALFRFVL
jgi:threonine dehydratase